MDDKVYEIEDQIAGSCAIAFGILVGFMLVVVLLMACNWLHSF